MPTTQPPIYVMKAEFFRVLGHPARVRILELLKEEEHNVGELQAALEIDSSGTSQHLAALRKIGLVDTRREGTSVYYRLRDRRTIRLLDVARQILVANLTDAQTLLEGLGGAESASHGTRPDSGKSTRASSRRGSATE